MEVVPPDDNGAGHLRRDDTAGEDAATDGDITSEGALLVYAVHVNDTVSLSIPHHESKL